MQVQIGSSNQGHPNQQNVDDGQGDQKMPAQPHQLVKAIPRYGESQPHEKVDVQAYFENEPEAAVNAGVKPFGDGHDDRSEQH